MRTTITVGIVLACCIAAAGAPLLWLAWRHGRGAGHWPMSARDTLLTIAMAAVLLLVLWLTSSR